MGCLAGMQRHSGGALTIRVLGGDRPSWVEYRPLMASLLQPSSSQVVSPARIRWRNPLGYRKSRPYRSGLGHEDVCIGSVASSPRAIDRHANAVADGAGETAARAYPIAPRRVV